MAEFILKMECDNAAFDDEPQEEIARILRVVANQINAGHDCNIMQDVNGNTVGNWDLMQGCDDDEEGADDD